MKIFPFLVEAFGDKGVEVGFFGRKKYVKQNTSQLFLLFQTVFTQNNFSSLILQLNLIAFKLSFRALPSRFHPVSGKEARLHQGNT